MPALTHTPRPKAIIPVTQGSKTILIPDLFTSEEVKQLAMKMLRCLIINSGHTFYNTCGEAIAAANKAIYADKAMEAYLKDECKFSPTAVTKNGISFQYKGIKYDTLPPINLNATVFYDVIILLFIEEHKLHFQISDSDAACSFNLRMFNPNLSLRDVHVDIIEFAIEEINRCRFKTPNNDLLVGIEDIKRLISAAPEHSMPADLKQVRILMFSESIAPLTPTARSNTPTLQECVASLDEDTLENLLKPSSENSAAGNLNKRFKYNS